MFPTRIFGSSHLAHAVLRGGGELWGHGDGREVLRRLSQLHGVVYFAALIVFAHRLRGLRARVFFLIAGVVSPAACFASGYLEVGPWPSMWATLALAFVSRARWEQSLSVLFLSIAAALHGLGLFHFAIAWPQLVLQSWSARLRTFLALFGVSGLALVAYMLLFRDMTLFPGDAHGGGNHSLLLALSSSELRSAVHWKDASALFFLGAPAALPALLLGRVKQRLSALLFVSGFAGPCLFLVLFNAALGWLFDIDMLVGGLIPSQTLALYFLFARRSPSLWTALVASGTAAGSTAFLWHLCDSWPQGVMHHF